MEIKLRQLLQPFSWLYSLGVWFRNKLFDWEMLPSTVFSVPVISVGNITVGGVGKTPHTEYLIRLLSPRLKVAVLSRGYKRKSSGFVLADKTSNSQTIGDEPYQMHRKFPHVLVAVDKKRKRGIANLLSLSEDKRPDVVLLDDAFQHRYVKPSLSILLVDYNRPIDEDTLLPAGNLREPAKNKSRADIVIITKCCDNLKPIEFRLIGNELNLYPYQSLFFTSLKYGNLTPVFDDQGLSEKKPEEIRTGKEAVLLLTGIASPQVLINEIRKYTENLETMIFPDHHRFSNKDLHNICQAFEQLQGERKMIITTEKDAMRLIDCPDLDNRLKGSFYYLPVEVIFVSGEEKLFKQKIEEHVENITRNRVMA